MYYAVLCTIYNLALSGGNPMRLKLLQYFSGNGKSTESIPEVFRDKTSASLVFLN